jgi:hypothetical protein
MFFNEDLNKIDMDISYDNMLKSMYNLNETYYGKNPDLVECENYFQALKDGLIMGKNPNNLKEKELIERKLAGLFGFERFKLIFLAEESVGNAFTVPFFYQKNYSGTDKFFKLVKSGNGIKYADPKGKVLYTYIYSYMLRNCSKEAIISILLHEIGHNFYLVKEQIQNVKVRNGRECVLYYLEVLKYYNWSSDVFPAVVEALLSDALFWKDPQKAYENYYKRFGSNKEFDKAIEKYKKANKKSFFNGLKKAFYVAFSIAGSILTIPVSYLNVLLLPLFASNNAKKQLKNNSKNSQSYNAEKFADNFAATYGYGAELAAAFLNPSTFSSRSALRSKIPIVRIQDYLDSLYAQFGIYFTDEHPNDMARIKFLLDKLKYELNTNKKDLDPRQIEDISQQIERIEKLLNDRPYFKKGLDNLVKEIEATKDEIGSNGTSNKEIYDFDKDIVNTHLKNESVKINIYQLEKDIDNTSILTENSDEILDKFFNDHTNFLNEIISEAFVS